MGLFSKLLHHDGEAPKAAPAAAETMADDAPAMTIYTTSWCASCFMAKRYLQQKGVKYEEIDIERVPEAAEKVMSLARGYKTVPTMIIGESVVVDWDQRALEQALVREGVLSG